MKVENFCLEEVLVLEKSNVKRYLTKPEQDVLEALLDKIFSGCEKDKRAPMFIAIPNDDNESEIQQVDYDELIYDLASRTNISSAIVRLVIDTHFEYLTESAMERHEIKEECKPRRLQAVKDRKEDH